MSPDHLPTPRPRPPAAAAFPVPGRAARVLLAVLLVVGLAAPVLMATSAGAAVTTADRTTVGLTSWSSGGSAAEYRDSAVELGVRFIPKTTGQVVGVRFYKTSNNTGVHTGTLWSPTGARLATATFTDETSTGWQSVRFSRPVTVAVGAEYTVSYVSPRGRYAATPSFFANALETPTLKARPWSSGVYRYGTQGGMPSSTYNATHYWVDVMFAATTSALPAPTTPAPAPTATPAPAPTATPAPTAPEAPAPTVTSTPAPTTATAAPAPTAPAPTTVAPSPTPTPATGTLPPGVVPSAGQVGYRGAASALRVIDSAATAPAGTTWSGGMLVVNNSNVVLDGVYVKGGLDYYGTGILTIRNSIIEGGAAWMVLMGRNQPCHIDIRDSTLRWKAGSTPPMGGGAGAIHGDCTLTALRNDISGTPDGIQNGPGNVTIEQNYIHDLAVMGTYPNNTHNDGMQFYNGSNIRIRFNRVDIGWNGTNQNGALFFQGSFNAPLIEGNYLSGGGFTLRLESGVRGAVVVNNTIKKETNAWGEVLVAPGTVGSWSGNRNPAGQLLGY